MKVLGITTLVVLLAFASTATAAWQEVYALPMGDYKVQFNYGGTINFGIYGGRGAMEMISPGDTHPSDAQINSNGKWHGTPMSEVQQINFGHMDLSAASTYGQELAYIFMVDWNLDGDFDHSTNTYLGHMRILPQMVWGATYLPAGAGTAAMWDPNLGGMPNNIWADLVMPRHLQCIEVSNTASAFGFSSNAAGLYLPGDDPTLESNHRFMSLEQIEGWAPQAYISGLGPSSWPTPETLEIAAGWFGSGSHFAIDYLDVYTGTTQVLGDANGDMSVDVGDLGILSAAWGQSIDASQALTNMDMKANFNGDADIDVGDLGIMSANWQTTKFALWAVDQTNFTDAPGGSDVGGVPLPSAFGAGLVLMGLVSRRRR